MSATKINLNKEIISLFSGQASVVTTPKLYIQLTGSHSLAIVLNQAVFWSNKSKCKDGFFYKTYEEWFEEVHIPERTLRRRFDRLEQYDWITTKVKKVHGKNTKHIKSHMDKIIESISTMLGIECPIRPTRQDILPSEQTPCVKVNPTGQVEQKPCTKVNPTGHIGRSEPATLAVSYIEADNYLQIINTSTAVSSSFFFSDTLDQNLLSTKLNRDERSDEEFMENVVDHVDNHSKKTFSRIVRAQGALKLLQKLKSENIIFYSNGKRPKDSEEKPKSAQKINEPFTPEELELVGQYKHALKMAEWGAPIEIHMPKEEQREKAIEILERMKALEANHVKTTHGQRL